MSSIFFLQPLGIVTWGCDYRMSVINVTDVKLFMEHRSQSPETDNTQGTYNAGIVQTSSPPSNESEAENDHFCQQLCDSPEDFTVVRFILYHYFLPYDNSC